jgi:hypothetical protein
MSTDINDLSSALVSKLDTVSKLHGVYNYEPDVPDDGKYPFATVFIQSGDGEFGDTIRNIRRHRFIINVYQERTMPAFGNEKAERIIRELIDDILTVFDADTTLSGVAKMVRPLSYDATYIQREVGDTRVVQFIGECMTVVPSNT